MKLNHIFTGLVLSIGLIGCASRQGDDRDTAAAQRDYKSLSSMGQHRVGISGNNCGEDRGGGQAYLEKSGSYWYLNIRNSKCANVIQPQSWGLDIKTDGSGSQDRSATIRFPGPGQYEVVLASNKYERTNGMEGMATIFNVTIVDDYPRPSYRVLDLRGDGRGEPIYMCGGIVKANSKGGQVNIVHEDLNLSRCGTFDILRDNGDRTDYPRKRLNGPSGSYTLSPKMYEAWHWLWSQENQILVSFGSEQVLVKFNAIRR